MSRVNTNVHVHVGSNCQPEPAQRPSSSTSVMSGFGTHVAAFCGAAVLLAVGAVAVVVVAVPVLAGVAIVGTVLGVQRRLGRARRVQAISRPLPRGELRVVEARAIERK